MTYILTYNTAIELDKELIEETHHEQSFNNLREAWLEWESLDSINSSGTEMITFNFNLEEAY